MVIYNGVEVGGSQTQNNSITNIALDAAERSRRRKKKRKQYTPAPSMLGPTQPTTPAPTQPTTPAPTQQTPNNTPKPVVNNLPFLNNKNLNTNLPFLNDGGNTSANRGYNTSNINRMGSVQNDQSWVKKKLTAISEYGNVRYTSIANRYKSASGLRKVALGADLVIARVVNPAFQIPLALSSGTFLDIVKNTQEATTPLGIKKYLTETTIPEKLGDVITVALPTRKLNAEVKNTIVSLGAKEVKYGDVFGEVTSKNKQEVITKFQNTIQKDLELNDKNIGYSIGPTKIGGWYDITTKKIKINVASPMEWKKKNREATLRHEITHSLDKNAKDGLEFNKARYDQTLKDIKKIGGKEELKATREWLKLYPSKELYDIESLARFSQLYPNEILKPTTKTGKLLNKIWKNKIDTRFVGVHTTSSKFNEFKGNAARRVEDSGVFLADWGSGNPSWLGLGDKTKFSFNPFKRSGNNPNVLKVEFDKVTELPKEVVSKGKAILSSQGRTAAYTYINQYYEKYARKGTAYIPFRTEIWETPETQVVLPYKFGTKLKREGNILQKLKGYREYVRVGNVNVPIRKFENRAAKDAIEEPMNLKKSNKELKNDIKDYQSVYDYDFTEYNTPSKYPSITSITSLKKSSSNRRSYSNSRTSNVPSISSLPSTPKPNYISKPTYYKSYKTPNSYIPAVPRIPRITYIPNIPRVPNENKRRKRFGYEPVLSSKGKTESGYRLIIKRGKNEKEIGGLFTRSDALRFGERTTLTSLAARFKIEKTPFMIKGRKEDYKVNTKLFRPYKIKNRRAIPLVNEYIQRRTKRLSTPFEIAELQRSRRSR